MWFVKNEKVSCRSTRRTRPKGIEEGCEEGGVFLVSRDVHEPPTRVPGDEGQGESHDLLGGQARVFLLEVPPTDVVGDVRVVARLE